MERMKNEDVIYNFVHYAMKCKNHGESLVSYGNKLFSYNTIIAQYTNEGLVINETKYSVITSKIQNMLKREATNYILVNNISMNTQDLSNKVATA